ncbi:MAG TPA: DUF4346 domain-containing protein [Thermoanaerobaculia bacterium]|nr:DUF4346 domain-containing protein [Thermoanaerobaculia bacterium]
MTAESAAFDIREQLRAAIEAKKCHPCGCFHDTVRALGETAIGRDELAADLDEARHAFTGRKYDCLGCQVCFPAIAANVFAQAYPEAADRLEACPTEAPETRTGWPPLPGDYQVVRYGAPVAVCTLNSDQLAASLSNSAPSGLSIAGTMHTENLGIERVIQNVTGNPHIRFLIVCGEDTQQAVGHLPGQSLASLLTHGLDENGRIRGAPGRRPVIKNVSRDHVEQFRAQVRLVSLIGETEPALIEAAIRDCEAEQLAPFEIAGTAAVLETTRAREPQRLVQDPAGFFVVYPYPRRGTIVVEHYANAGVLTAVIEGATSAALYATIIDKQLISRLDHSAYLGRELARAEQSLKTGEPYVQDRAAGEIDATPAATSCCSTKCK